MKRDKFFYGQASLFYCILFIIAIFISFCSNAQAEENYIWLQQSDIKYSEDGSAFCEVVLKKGTADLQVMKHDILSAQCLYRFRRSHKGEKIEALQAENIGTKTVFKVAAPVSTSCNVLVKLSYQGKYYTAQSNFSLYGDSWNKKNFTDSEPAVIKLIVPRFEMDYNYYPQTGQKLFFKYIAASKTGLAETEKEVTVLIDGQKQTERLKPDADGAFTYTAAKAAALTVTPDNRAKSTIFIIQDEENGAKITSTLNINVYDSRYGYLDIKQGIILFLAVSAISAAGIWFYLRRPFGNAYK